MNENYYKNLHHRLVHTRHDTLKKSGVNPSLDDVREELKARDGLHLSKNEIGELLLEPVEAGRRGTSKKSQQAHSASCRASVASCAAIDEQSHADASKSHAEAARQHRVTACYHDEQSEFHADKANPKPVTDESQSDEVESAAPLSCARALTSMLGDSIAQTLDNVTMFMPGGIHRITPSRAGKPVTVVVEVDSDSAAQMERQRQILAGGGNPPFFSLEHTSDIAAFWPTRFFWDTRRDATGAMASGVWAEGNWTEAGREAVGGRSYRSFSPVFFVNKISNDESNPARVICNPDAKLNCGAFLNSPAFETISPLWTDTSTARA